MRLVLIIVSILSLALAGDDARADTCPLSCVFDVCTTVPRNSSTRCGPTVFGADACGTAGYDLVAGSAGASVNSGGDGGPFAEARATDRFVLTGPTSPDAVSFTAALSVVAGAGCFCGGTEGTLREGAGTALSVSVPYYDPVCGCPAYFVDRILSLSLRHRVGEPFELTYTASAGAQGISVSSRASVTLSFPGLPPGYGIVSCQGFATGAPVPTRPASWGSLKVRYR